MKLHVRAEDEGARPVGVPAVQNDLSAPVFVACVDCCLYGGGIVAAAVACGAEVHYMIMHNMIAASFASYLFLAVCFFFILSHSMNRNKDMDGMGKSGGKARQGHFANNRGIQ